LLNLKNLPCNFPDQNNPLQRILFLKIQQKLRLISLQSKRKFPWALRHLALRRIKPLPAKHPLTKELLLKHPLTKELLLKHPLTKELPLKHPRHLLAKELPLLPLPQPNLSLLNRKYWFQRLS
jgi:hypothetical protein